MSLVQGSDAIINQKLGYQAYNRLKNHFIKATNPGDLQNGMIWFDSATQTWFGKRTAGLFDFTLEPSVFIEGMIVPWVGGYFTNAANAGYTRVLAAANTAAAVNALVNAQGWYVCDGAALNDPLSTIFNGASRYLPNLTDDRFLMGDNAVGVIGGSSSSAHTHGVGSIAAANESAHAHAAGAVTVNAEAAHAHAAGAVTVNAEAAHTHGAGTFAAASHGHAVGTLAAAAEATHTHGVSGTSGAGSAHTHSQYNTGVVDGGAHTHSTYDVAAGSGSTVYLPGPNQGTHGHTLYWEPGSEAAHTHAVSITSGAGASHTHGLSGSTDAAAPAVAGTSAAGSSHTHTASGAATGAGSSHTHTASGAATGAGAAHTHAISGTSDGASASENRPSFLGCFYLMYVKAA